MPDASGALTSSDAEKVKSWFATHWKGTVICPVCKSNAWTYGSHVVNLPRYAVDAAVPGTLTFPHLPVVCNTCANTLFFNATNMGLFQQAPPSPVQRSSLANALSSLVSPPAPPLGLPRNPLLGQGGD